MQKIILKIFIYPLVCIIAYIFISSTGFSLEKRQGIVRANQSIHCIYQCDTYYLEPDAFNTFIYLVRDGMTTINLSQYKNLHVEVTGYQAHCGDCADLVVTYIRTLPVITAAKLREKDIPVTTTFGQNYPNPFNPTTAIYYDIRNRSRVRLVILDVLGREISQLVSGIQLPGRYVVEWNASNQPGGVYLYRMNVVDDEGKSESSVRKMLYLK